MSDGLLDALAVGRVAGRAGASLALVDEAADLVRRAPRVLLAGAEAVHSGFRWEQSSRSQSFNCVFTVVVYDDDDDDDGDDDDDDGDDNDDDDGTRDW